MILRLSTFKPAKGQLVFLLIGLASLYLILPQVGVFKNSLNGLSNVNWKYLSLAIVFQIITYVFAAITYRLLAKHKLKYPRTLVIQLAGSFVNRLLPSGIGGMGVNYFFLKANKHTSPESASVVAVNNLLGGIGNLLLLIFAFFAFRASFSRIHLENFNLSHGIKVILLLLVLIAIIALLSRYRQKVLNSLRVFSKQVIAYRKHPTKLVLALMSSVALTTSNVICLHYSATSLGAHIGFVTALIILTIGIAFGSATPTPGGLGGIDAALVVSMVAFSMPVSLALAVTLTFRLISSWLPVLVGIVALYFAERNNYFNSRSKILG